LLARLAPALFKTPVLPALCDIGRIGLRTLFRRAMFGMRLGMEESLDQTRPKEKYEIASLL
jgi:hypothetical protein